MSQVKILSPGPLSTIQDGGRYKHQQSGMSVSGVMDSYSQRIANMLVGNPQEEAVIECTLMGPMLEFNGDSAVAVTGGTAQPMLNGAPVPMWETLHVKSGDKLSFQAVTKGCRLYIAFAGGIGVPEVMGSKSTYVKAGIGGLDGRPLKKDDVLNINGAGVNVAQVPVNRAGEQLIAKHDGPITLRVVLGPQEDAFTHQGIRTLLGEAYTVTTDCDRMGYRLDGPVIEHKDGGDIISDGIVMGAIQVPGNGKPIILMSDRQTTGGYTKIATVITSDLPKVAQARPGSVIRFQQVSVEQAQSILLEIESKLNDAAAAMSRTVAPAAAPTPVAAPVAVPPAQQPAGKGVSQYTVTVNGQAFDVTVEEY